MAMAEEVVINSYAHRGFRTELTLQAQLDNIHPAYDIAQAAVEPEATSLSPEARFALTTVSIVAVLTRRLFDNRLLARSELGAETGGKMYNPGRKIDDLAAAAVRYVAENFGLPLVLRIEEGNAKGKEKKAEFEPFSTDSHLLDAVADRRPRIVICDEIDGTSGIKDGREKQTSGILIADADGEFKAGAIASLVDQRIILVTEKGEYFYLLDEASGSLVVSPTPKRSQWTPADNLLRVASLKRRFDQMQSLPFFQYPPVPIEKIPDMGGYQLLNMVFPIESTQPLHVLIDVDPGRGQPWFEFIWPQIAERLGLFVRNGWGKPIQYQALIQYMYRTPKDSSRTDEFAPRIPLLICLNKDLYNFVAPKLNLPAR